MEQNNEEMTELKRLWNSYFYPNLTVLINKLGITNQEELEQKEAELETVKQSVSESIQSTTIQL